MNCPVGQRKKMHLLLLSATAAIWLLPVGASAAGQETRRADLGRTVKLRILVDKVMQPEAGWTTKEWMVREAAQAGFNVFSPRSGHDRADEVKQVTGWCAKYGIFHMPWMRGTLPVPAGAKAEGKRVLWASGSEQPLWSVCSDEFWEWTTRYIVEYAKLSAATDRLIGVFLDYENYWRGGSGNLYQITYEDVILDPFLKAKGIQHPELSADQRKAWLTKQGLHQEFVQFQIDHWRTRCRQLRREVDKHDPTFQFCIYPSPGTPFMVQACYPEWSTERGPIILADPWVYGRPSKFLPQHEALQANRQKLLNGMKIPQQAGIPFIYSGGIDPIVTGADPEFCGKNAVMISELTGGYWVFYEGPKYKKDHRDYFHWFKWANERIEAKDFKAWHEPRATAENWVLEAFEKLGAGAMPVAPQSTGAERTLSRVTLRRENLLLLAAKQGQPVEIVLQNRPVGRYVSLLAWEIRDIKQGKVASGMIPHQQKAAVRFTPEQDGLYLLAASAGSCAYSVVSSNVPLGLLTADGASFIGPAGKMYLHVPAGVREWTITATGWHAETVRVDVFDPDGRQVASGQTSPRKETTTIKVPAGGHAGKTWSLLTSRADKGVIEDYSIKLSTKVTPVLAFAPEDVFTPGAK